MKRHEIRQLGSHKSGNWGHAGRPGKRGGSLSRSVAMSIRTGKNWRERQAAKKGKSTFGSSKVTSESNAGGGVNGAVILEFEDGSKGIFKTAYDMEYGSAESEILAYELSDSLGWDIVPETIMYTYKGETGSLQKWVDDAEVASRYSGTGIKVDRWDLEYSDFTKSSHQSYQDKIVTMDWVLGNEDRHAGNWLIGQDRLVAIDNGGAFGIRFGGKRSFTVSSFNPRLGQRPPAKEVKAWSQTPAANDYFRKVERMLGRDYADKLRGALQ